MAIPAYTKTEYVNDSEPAINATNLNNAEDQIKAISDDFVALTSFTPTVLFGGASVGVTYSSQFGAYQIINGRIFFDIRITLSSKGSSTGNATIGGLPSSSAIGTNGYTSVTIGFLNKITFANIIEGYINNGENYIRLSETTEAGTLTQMTDADFANDSVIILSGNYPI
jgi:hypothetical protein